MKNKNMYEEIIKKLAKQYKITVQPYYNGAQGKAFINRSFIRIPKKLDSLSNFETALHEIGHIVEGRQKTSYETEYVAMQWALNKLKELKLYSKVVEYSERAYFTMK